MSEKTDIFNTLTDGEQHFALSAVYQAREGINSKNGSAPPEPPAAALAGADEALVDYAELITEPAQPTEYLVDGLLARGHLALLSGRPKSGKSWLVMQLAMAVDNGAPFLGRPTRQGRVFHAALEDGRKRVQERAKLMGWTVRNEAKARFVLPSFCAPNGDLGPGLALIRKLSSRFDLMLIDTLSATLSGRINENDNAAMGAIVNELARIAHDTGCAILVVHHTAKAFSEDDRFTGVRGASAIRAAYDVGLLLEHKAGEDEGVLRVESRDADVEGMTIRKVKDGVGWELVGYASEINRIRAGKKAVEALQDLDEATTDEIAQYLGITSNAAYRQLARAERDGLIYRHSGEKEGKGRPADLWSLTPKPQRPATGGEVAGQGRFDFPDLT